MTRDHNGHGSAVQICNQCIQSPNEEREDAIFCSLSQVLPLVVQLKINFNEQVDQVKELKRLCGLEDAEEARGGGDADHPDHLPPTFQPITGDQNLPPRSSI